MSVDYSGCERVVTGPICELSGPRTLTFWMPGSFRGYEWRSGGATLSWAEQPVAGGYQVKLAIDPGADALRLERSGVSHWQLRLGKLRPSELLSRAQAAKDQGELPLALEQAQALSDSASPLEATLAQGIAARVYLRLGRTDEATRLLEQTTPQLFELGQLSEGTKDAFALLFILSQRRDALDAARAWLLRWRDRVSRYPLGRALLADHEGMLHATAGEPVAALHEYRNAERQYERLGEPAHGRRVAKEQVGLLVDIGQMAAAHQLQRRLLPPLAGEPDCTKAQLYILHAWLTFLQAEAGQREPALELPSLLERSEKWERRCGDPEIVVTGLVNRGLWALHQADLRKLDALERELRAQPQRQTPELRAWVTELHARSALARGQHREARELFELEGVMGRSSGRLDPELRALLGLAAVADALGARAEEEERLREAIHTLERAQRWDAFGSLVYSQFASRQRAAHQLTRRLLERNETREAYRVGLSAYRSALSLQARRRDVEGWPALERARFRGWIDEYRKRRRQLDEAAENDWQLSSAELRVAEVQRQAERQELESLLQRAADSMPGDRAWQELPEPAPGEYWLLVLPFATPESAGWTVLGTDGAQARAAQLSDSELERPQTPPSPDHPLLAPFADSLAKAERIVIFPAGRARALAFESWALRGRPLSTRRLAFGAALSALEGRVDARPRAPAISADPRGDLPFSRQESAWVASMLEVPPERQLMGAEVNASNLLKQLESSDFLHFAGHARLNGASEGPALLLANGAELQSWELFSLGSVPRQVVLSACEAGDSRSRGVGWGLAQAFLALGTESVVAPLGAVEDEEAFRVQRRLYRALGDGLPLREAFWRAQREAGPSKAVFRLFIR